MSELAQARQDRPRLRRSPSGGGYARGEEARSRIIDAALTRFAADGFDRASTRRIAQDAGVNPPALQYYFDGKDGLHMACAQRLAEHFAAALRGVFAGADSVATADRTGAVEALVVLIDAIMDYWFERDGSESAARFMARGQGEEGTLPAYRWLREVVGRDIHDRARRLVAEATNAIPTDPLTRVRTMAILAPIKAFHVGQADVAARLGWPDLHGERLALIKQVIAEQTRASLHAAVS